MVNQDKIYIATLCATYKIEEVFIYKLHELELIELEKIDEQYFISHHTLETLEKMIHMHQDLHINIEGIDAIFNLLNKVENLSKEVIELKNKLSLYE